MLVDVLTAAARGLLHIDGRKCTIVTSQPDNSRRPVRRALISVYDKTGLTELARGLAEAGVEIVSTGSTAQRIAEAGVEVTPVDSLTGFPECLEGRVKTLHPRVHAGILADTRKPEHLEQIADLDVKPFELVVVNLYPFTDTVASGADYDACVRADRHRRTSGPRGAKNHLSVAVLVDPADYGRRLRPSPPGLQPRPASPPRGRRVPPHRRLRRRGGHLDDRADHRADRGRFRYPVWRGRARPVATLRYGENPHQSAPYTDAARRRASRKPSSCTARR